MCVIGSLNCNQNDKLYVIMTIPFLQCSIICVPLVNLTFVSVTNFEIKSLAFVSCGYSSPEFASAFSFYMSNHVQIIDVSFFGDSSLTSSAGILSLSNVSISNSYFTGSSSASGGALVISLLMQISSKLLSN